LVPVISTRKKWFPAVSTGISWMMMSLLGISKEVTRLRMKVALCEGSVQAL
jgi:hypothetical protein